MFNSNHGRTRRRVSAYHGQCCARQSTKHTGSKQDTIYKEALLIACRVYIRMGETNCPIDQGPLSPTPPSKAPQGRDATSDK